MDQSKLLDNALEALNHANYQNRVLLKMLDDANKEIIHLENKIEAGCHDR